MKKKYFMGLMSTMILISSQAGLSGRQAHAGQYLNKHLPKWLEMDLQLRHRYEWMSDFDFNKNVDDNKGFSLWRARLALGLKPNDMFKLFYQLQDARISNDSVSGSKAAYENWGETRQLWAEVNLNKLPLDKVGLTNIGVRFGRQEFSYGAQRLLGAFDWSNVSQTFDAGKVMLDFGDKSFKVDIFGGGKTPVKSPREMDDFYDGSSNDVIGGYYAAYSKDKNFLFEQYLIRRDTDGKKVSFGQTGDGAVEDYTIGGRMKGKFGSSSWDYELEAAKQFGNSGRLDVDAQMAVGIIGYTFPVGWKPRASFEFDYASGDNDSSDGDRETFDNLHPTNHLFYGYMDFVSLQNINNYHFQLAAYPHKGIELQMDYHLIYLDTPKDNLYSAGRTIKRATVAGADSYVGGELDLLTKFKATDFCGMLVGYSHFFAGQFLSDTGISEDADYFYVQTTLNF